MVLCKILSLSLSVSPSDGQYLSFCPSDCASLYHSGVRRSGVYTIVLSPGVTLPVYCDMESEGETHTIYTHMHIIQYVHISIYNTVCVGAPKHQYVLIQRHVCLFVHSVSTTVQFHAKV